MRIVLALLVCCSAIRWSHATPKLGSSTASQSASCAKRSPSRVAAANRCLFVGESSGACAPPTCARTKSCTIKSYLAAEAECLNVCKPVLTTPDEDDTTKLKIETQLLDKAAGIMAKLQKSQKALGPLITEIDKGIAVGNRRIRDQVKKLGRKPGQKKTCSNSCDNVKKATRHAMTEIAKSVETRVQKLKDALRDVKKLNRNLKKLSLEHADVGGFECRLLQSGGDVGVICTSGKPPAAFSVCKAIVTDAKGKLLFQPVIKQVHCTNNNCTVSKRSICSSSIECAKMSPSKKFTVQLETAQF